MSDIYLYLGAGGLVHLEVTYGIVLTPAQIKLYSYNFKFYDVKEQKIRDYAIYSRFHHFSEGGISFELNGNVYNVGLSPTGDKFYQRYDYKRHLFKDDPYYQCQNQIFIFDTVNDTFIVNDGDYHQVVNDWYQRYGRGRPDPNQFFLEYYWTIKPYHKNVICNMTTYVDLTPAEGKLIAFIQNDTPGKVQVNTTIGIFAVLRIVRGYGSTLRQANHIPYQGEKKRGKVTNFRR